MTSGSVTFNAAYSSTFDGTGTWTRTLLDVQSDWTVVQADFDPSRRERAAFLEKIRFELRFRRNPGRLRVHPYAAATLDRRAALTILNVPFDEQGRRGWHPILVRASIALADRVATISRDQQDLLRKRYRRSFSLLTPHPEPEFFRATMPAPTSAATTRIAYWGGWHERKGMVELLSELEPTDEFHFVVTGRPPAEIANRPDVTTLGYLTTPELVTLIDSAALAIYPSYAEGFGLPPYEALLRNRPLIARQLPSYRDFIKSDAEGVHWLGAGATVGQLLRLARDDARRGVNARAALETPSLDAARTLLASQVDEWLS